MNPNTNLLGGRKLVAPKALISQVHFFSEMCLSFHTCAMGIIFTQRPLFWVKMLFVSHGVLYLWKQAFIAYTCKGLIEEHMNV